jgi:(p)ppGpp synthase/HD superfamily hydrolase
MLSEKFIQAVSIANVFHKGHVRKGTQIPYISHLMAVASLVMEGGGSEDEIIAALLHDAVEDCGGEPILDEIKKHFGQNVASIVDDLTETYENPKPPWKGRKEAYISHIKEANPSVRLVSCADKLHNVRCILSDYRQEGETLWNRFSASKEETLWFYQSMANVLCASGRGLKIYADLDSAVKELGKIIKRLPTK